MNKENNIFFRKKNSFCSNSSKLSKEFFEIENASLYVLISRNINFRINEVNIIHEKKVENFFKNFANTSWINEKMTKIFVFHTIMIIVFNSKTLKFEIKMKSSFKFYINNLSKSFLHWKNYVATFACWKYFENCANKIRRDWDKKNVKNR